MVVFTCGHCGESVQKPKVEKHYLTQCRNRNPNLSCMDCFKDFFGQDYESHIKCVTEEERYSGKGFTPKEKKGEKKQTAWVEMLQSVLDEQKAAPRNVLRIIETISKHNNTPRKKPKFINFVKNVCGQKTNPKDMDQAWDMISVKLSALSNNNANQNKNQTKSEDPITTNGNKEDEKTNGKKKLENGDAGHKNGEADTPLEKEETVNGEADNSIEKEVTVNGDAENEETDKQNGKKLSKKERKEEKKRMKYEAELQSAVAPVVEEEEGETQASNKKGKKKKNRTESANNEEEIPQAEGKNKHKKRKRQDTTNSVVEAPANTENIENMPVNSEKTQKKKLKVIEPEANESICLHDQNVAKSEVEEATAKNDEFNWHAVIMSVLQKKGDELPFKRLQKKVLSEYSEMTGRDVDDRIADKFIKKLKSAPNVKVDKNRVYLED